ncbi:MAG: ATP-binding protein [Terracidiphilus sp.]
MATCPASDPSTVEAYPAKTFFVDMLTRDIDLKDAILDLLDNCLDGAMRLVASPSVADTTYRGRWAEIEFDRNRFSIKDNCGGIPVDIARHSAFRMGRTDRNLDKDIPTVGVYGIGMKRAIFKLGRDAAVESMHQTEKFTVKIDRGWMENDQAWTIPISIGTADLTEPGTHIVVQELREEVSRLLSNETDFVTDLKNAISDYYGLIIEKGFTVRVNGDPIQFTQNGLLVEDLAFNNSAGIMPYVYHAEKDGIVVSVVVGFYRNLPDENEEEESLAGKPSSEQAGITVVCNDRVVVYADKTRITGWGEATVPQYHTQFVSITGLVTFSATNASLLPLTTTKRGLDGNSQLYLEVKDHIREGIKFFTDFTNRWKGASIERQNLQIRAKSVTPTRIALSVPPEKQAPVRKGMGGWKFKPQLPLPQEADPMRQIKFSRRQSQIAAVANYLFDDPSTAPADVGGKCFDDFLRKAAK